MVASETAPVLAELTKAKVVAVVGASPRNLVAQVTISNLRRFGAGLHVYGVHPEASPDAGALPVASLADIPEPVDLCVPLVGSGSLLSVVNTAAELGVKGFVIPGGGGNEGGPAIANDLKTLIRARGLGIVGPNCMGFVSFRDGPAPYIGSIDPAVQSGHVGLVSHSGSICEICTALPWRIGFSHVISVGNEFGLDMAEALEFLVSDAETKVIGLFVEGIRRPSWFREGLEAAARAGKPVVVLKVGRSEVGGLGAASHTGSMVGDCDVFSGVLRAANAIEVRDIDQMLALLEILGKGLLRPAGKVVLVGDSGGQANLFADLASDHGVDLPRLGEGTASELRRLFPNLHPAGNPLDLWALGPPREVFDKGVSTLLAGEPHLTVIGLDKFLSTAQAGRDLVAAALAGVTMPGSALLMAYGGPDSADPVLLETCWRKGIAVTRGADLTLSALAAVDRWYVWRGRVEAPDGEREALEEPAFEALADTLGDGKLAWSEHASKQLLKRIGIPVPDEVEVRTVDAAVASASQIGYPVAIKASRPDLLHKSDGHGVRLNLGSDLAVAGVAAELLAAFPAVLVCEQVAADLELIVSAFCDPDFGPCCLVGVGGSWVEMLGDPIVVVGPGSFEEFRRALETRRWGRLLLRGARGREFPVEAVAALVLRLIGVVGSARGRIKVIEVNPLFVRADGVVAVDALVIPA